VLVASGAVGFGRSGILDGGADLQRAVPVADASSPAINGRSGPDRP
jgi:hypothetical protein